MIPRYYKETSFEQFRTFCEVARRGSFSGAAVALRLARSTVWQQLDGLEREFGVKLLRRRGRGMEVTPEGHELLELVRGPVAALDSTKEVFLARLHRASGQLRLAVIQSTELRPAIRGFLSEAPGVQLILIEKRSMEIVPLVEEDGCDLGFALVLPGLPRAKGLHYEPVGARGLSLILPLKHPLARKPRIRAQDLVPYPLITWIRDNPLRRYVDTVFEREGLLAQMKVVVETDLLESSEQCVSLGLGLGIGTWPAGRKPSAPVQVRALGEHFGSIPLVLLWKEGKHHTPATTTFVRLVHESLKGTGRS
jgi:DNA-binding transcriptional LysR family regulator